MESAIILFLTFKLLSLLAGLIFAYLGYRLLLEGISDSAGDLQAVWKDKRLLLKRGAPGVFFALFGMAIVAFTVATGLSLDSKEFSLDASEETSPLPEQEMAL